VAFDPAWHTKYKEVHDVSWGRLIGMLRYKAVRAGGIVIEVDPYGTSQTCPDCGVIKKKELSERVHRCLCGCVLDRDVAAAKVILHRAGNRPGQHNALAKVRAGRKMCEAA
jgi:putative transposase